MRARNRPEVYESRKMNSDWLILCTASIADSCAQLHNSPPSRHEFIQPTSTYKHRMTLTANAGVKKSFRARAVRSSPHIHGALIADPVV